MAQTKELKVGVIYDLTGPLAAGGSNASYLGTKYAIDMFNERGGTDGWKVKPVYADAQSKPDVAINEYERLVNQEKVDMVMGVFSSAHCVPMAQKAEATKKFMWANVCVASAVLKDKKMQYVFRAQVHSDQFGEASCTFLNEQAKAKLGKDPKDLKVAVIYEDGPYGSGVASGNESACKAYGMQVVLKEGYAATSPDLSPLVTKLKRARPDVILHTGYNPDITLFLRQSKEQALRWSALIGHGCRLWPVRQALRHLQGRRQLPLQRRPRGGTVAQPGFVGRGHGRCDQGDGAPLQGRREGRRGAAARVHGLQPGLGSS